MASMTRAAAHAGRRIFQEAVGDAGGSDDEFALDFAVEESEASETKAAAPAVTVAPYGAMTFGVVTETSEGEKSLAVKPFIGQIFAPTTYRKSADHLAAPAASVELQHVWGANFKKTRDSLFLLADGERLFWPSASVGVVQPVGGSGSQTHLVGHEDEILAAAASPADSNIIATGSSQLKRKHDVPRTIVWDASTGQQIASLRSRDLKRQIDALSFDTTGEYVFAIGCDDAHTLVAFSVSSGSAVSSVPTGRSRALCMAFDPRARCLVIGGVKSLFIVPVGAGGRLGVPEQVSSTTTIAAVATRTRVLVGDKKGSLMALAGGSLKARKDGAHKRGIYSIASSRAGGNMIATGGGDGRVCVWKQGRAGFTLCSTIHVAPASVPIKGLAMASEDAIFAGTRNAEVLRVSASAPSSPPTVLMDAHFDGETWGLAMHPFDHTCATTGDDNTLRIWDLLDMSLVRKRDLTEIEGKSRRGRRKKMRRPRSLDRKRGGASTTGSFEPANCSRAVDYDPMAEQIAVGFNDGSFMVVRESDLETVCHMRAPRRSQWVQDLKYSTADPVLAVSTHDNSIDLFNFAADPQRPGFWKYKRFAVIDGHNSFITHFDWSSDGRYIQSNCGAYELLFWDTLTRDRRKRCEMVSASELRDIQWHTQTCVVGWPVTGIWYAPEGYLLNACDRSKSEQLLAVAEDSSRLSLYKYPCVGTFRKSGRDPQLGGAEARTGTGHGSHVCNVRFNFDDSCIVTVGGDDNATMVWRVV